MSKKKEKSKKIYCVFCGLENDAVLEICSNCKKNLHPKNHLFRDFLYDHIKDDLKGKVTDSIFSYLKNFIISHLYGTGMFLSVIFTTVVVITSSISGNYKIISDLSEMKTSSNSNEITIRVYTYDDSCASDFDQELVDIPFTAAGAISGLRKVAQEITINKGTSLNDWCSNDHKGELICAESLFIYNSDLEKSAKIYREKVLEYAKWVRANGISDSNEYARRNSELDQLSYGITSYENLNEYDKSKGVNQSVELFVPLVGCLYEN